MERIIPGVQVQVVKEVLPPRLAPAGVLGLVGLAEKEDKPVVRVSSWTRFVEVLGPGTAYSMPEARQALANGVFELVVCPVTSDSALAASTSCKLYLAPNPGARGVATEKTGFSLTLKARAKGPWADNITAELKSRDAADGKVLDLTLKGPNNVKEIHRNLTLTPVTDRYITDVLQNESALSEGEVVYFCEEKKLSIPLTEFDIEEIPEMEIPSETITLLKLTGDVEIPLLQLKVKDTEDKLYLTIIKTADGASLTITRTKDGGEKEEVLKDEIPLAGDISAVKKKLEKIKKELEKNIKGCEVILAEINKKGVLPEFVIEEISDQEIPSTPVTLLKSMGDVKIPLLQLKVKDTEDKLNLTIIKTADGASLTITRTKDGGEKEEVLKREILKHENLFLPEEAIGLRKDLEKIEGCEVILPLPTIPATDQKLTLQSGSDATREDYAKALGRLENEPDVDMVLAAVQDFSEAAQIYTDVISHCDLMSADCKGRIGFGQVASGVEIDVMKAMAEKLVSDRFILVTPHDAVGAVAGMIGSLQYFRSPTFKRIAGISDLSRNLGVEDQRTLLKSHLLPVVTQRERGTIVLHGLTTDGDQISVRRVADRAVRGVKSISELFIGRLNNEAGRGALKQKLIEFLIQMEKDGAIVPSTDGTDPAYKIDVYSSQADFAQGIVRVDLAVRPVRAIDYIYATILVQV